MKQKQEYEKPMLEEYPYFGVVIDGQTGGPGDDQDDNPCNKIGIDDV